MPEPLSFVESSRNSIAAAGGAGREGIETTRELAPMTVRTLDRAVSLSDYADLARTHAGIGKARADWGWEEGRRSILLTVATVDGAALPPALKESLRAHLESRRSPHHRLLIRDHRPWPVRLSLDIQVLPSFVQIETKRRVEEALGRGLAAEGGKGYFHFDRRGLGEDIFLSDIYAAVEGVRGVDNTVARAFHPETATPPSEPILDRIRVPADALATGGHPTDALVGILQVRAAGGVR
jgi:predicted phage baseplate assembly protein